jgi:transcriptional regulator with PAS, ATPase and Fis domain
MERTAAAQKTSSDQSTQGTSTSAIEPKSMISKLADIDSVEEGLQLVLNMVSALGCEAQRATMLRAGQTTQVDGLSANAGVSREIEGRFGDIALVISYSGATTPEVNAHLQTIASVAALSAERWARRSPAQSAAARLGNTGLVGSSLKMQELDNEIRMAARSAHSVLIKGESGTGKTTAATKIHECSIRSSKPFVHINCATIPEALLESELFGHEKGAFTGAGAVKKGLFELAEGGTLFLDEVAEMKVELQAKLLTAIEQKQIRRIGGSKSIQCDVRIIAATSRNLIGMIQAGTFREDLYYRLAVLEVHVAPLRERRGDIPALIQHRLDEEQRLAMRAEPYIIELGAIDQLVSYDWPGNIRELQNLVSRLTARVDEGNTITRENVLAILSRLGHQAVSTYFQEEGALILPAEVRALRPGESLQDFINRVRVVVIEAAKTNEGSLTRAAKRLNYNRTSFGKLVARLRHTPEGKRLAVQESDLMMA